MYDPAWSRTRDFSLGTVEQVRKEDAHRVLLGLIPLPSTLYLFERLWTRDHFFQHAAMLLSLFLKHFFFIIHVWEKGSEELQRRNSLTPRSFELQ
jgi:hypothetical protein